MSAYDQLLADLFTTAIEGGINYWASVERYHWMLDSVMDEAEPSDLEGFYADIDEVSDEPDGIMPHHIDRDTMVRGYRLAATEWRDRINWSSGEKPPLIVTDDTEWDFDAGDADAIVQLGLFGEVVYG